MIGIIGLGNLGSALATHLPGPLLLYDREPKPFPTQDHAQAVIDQSSLVFLALPDDELESFVRAHRWSGTVVHTSGSMSLDVLRPAQAAGARIGGFHPLQTFRGNPSFEGIAVGIEAEDPLFAELAELARALGARPIRLEAAQKVPYHLAASMVSNFTVTLFEQAQDWLEQAGIPSEEARAMLLPLLAGTVENLRQGNALTGPIARGDAGTVQRHLRFLRPFPDQTRLYRTLAEQTLALADLPPLSRERINRIFKEEALCEPC